MNDFLSLIAWIFGGLSAALVILRAIAALRYSEIEELRDQVNGVKTTFPIVKPGIIFIICAAWLITNG